MNKNRENIYKVCRNNARFTQEEASELLCISVRTLAGYESNANVPDDIVAKMAEIYKSPLLAWRHLKENSILGKFLPDVVLPKTNCDMAFQAVIAQDDLAPIVSQIKKIMADGVVSEDETESFDTQIELIKSVNAKLTSIIIYAGKPLGGK